MPPQTPGQDSSATPQTPPPTQDQGGAFDYLGDMRKRYPGLTSKPDKDVWDYLGKPENFRKVYPRYKDLDDYTIEFNIGNLAKGKPQKAAAPQVTPPVVQPKVPPAQPQVPPTGRPQAPGTAVTPQPAAAAPHTASTPPPQKPPQAAPAYTSPQTQMFAAANKELEELMKRPSWADPSKIAQDPTWYGRSLRYAGGEFIGAGRGGAGLMVGGAKMLHDVASALDPIEGYQHPYEAQKQVGRDIVDVGKGLFDVGKGAWDMLKDLSVAVTTPGQASELAGKYADPDKFGKDMMNLAFTVDGSVELAKAMKLQNIKPSEVVDSLNQARKGTVNVLMKKNAVEKTYVHKNGVAVAEEILRAEKAAQDHVKEHVTNLTEKIGDKPVEADSTVQRIKDQATQKVKTEPPGKMARGKGPRAGIPEAVPSPLDDVIAYVNTVKPGSWTWETVKQFRSEVGRAMSRAYGPELSVLTDIYVNDLTPKLRDMARQYKLQDSWNAYNSLEAKIQKGFPAIEKARAIIDNNGEGAAMAQALKDPAILKEVIESLKPHGLDVDMVRDYAGLANKVLRESGEFNKSMFRYVYRISPASLISLPMMVAGRELGGWQGGLILGAGSGFAMNYLMHTLRAMKMSPALLDEVIRQRKWPGRTPIPKGEGFDTPSEPTPSPGTPPTPTGPPGEPPPAPGTPPAPVPGGAQPTPTAQAAAQAATATPKPKAKPKEAAPAPAKPAYTGPERRSTERKVTQDLWAKNQIDEAKKQIAKATDENEKNILRRRIEELEKDPTLAGGGEELGRDIRAARAAKPAQPIVPQVTKVTEGEAGREPGKRPGTTKETDLTRANKQRERVAAKRAKEGQTALGGGGLEVSGGGAGEAAIKAKADEAARAQAGGPGQDVQVMPLKEKEAWLKANDKENFGILQEIKKTAAKKKVPLTDEDYLTMVNKLVVDRMEEISAENQAKAKEMMKEAVGEERLSPQERAIQQVQKDKETLAAQGFKKIEEAPESETWAREGKPYPRFIRNASGWHLFQGEGGGAISGETLKELGKKRKK